MPGAPLSLPEREEIGLALTQDPAMPWAQIAARVGRHPTTIFREVTVGGGRHAYRPAMADRRAERCRGRPRPRRLVAPSELRDRIVTELGQGRSPVAITLDLDAEAVPGRPCAETIYLAVYDGTLGVNPRACLRMRRPRRRSRTARNPSNRPALPNIVDRPARVNDRAEPGHWEVDQIIG